MVVALLTEIDDAVTACLVGSAIGTTAIVVGCVAIVALLDAASDDAIPAARVETGVGAGSVGSNPCEGRLFVGAVSAHGEADGEEEGARGGGAFAVGDRI